MAKELRITATVPMPDDTFEQGAKLSEFKPAIEALAKALGVTVHAEVVRPVKRKPKETPAPALVKVA